MFRCILFRLFTLVAVAIAITYPVAASHNLDYLQAGTPTRVASAPLACDPDGVQQSGAIYRICMPTSIPWNGDLLVFAHGYVSPTEPLSIPEDQMILPGGTSIADAVTQMGVAFATTSYSTTGLAVLQGIVDLVDLVDIFTAEKGTPGTVYLVGGSEGGLITALAVEQYPDVFDGGLAMCGPYGDFGGQLDHLGDFRVVFDYFFPDLMPDNPIDIPAWLMEDWDTYYETTIRPEIEDPANISRVEQLLNVTNISYDAEDPNAKEGVVQSLLWYNVFGTNDAKIKVGGQPFDNEDRVYSGSDDDDRLNQGVQRFHADQAAIEEIADNYQTTGKLSVPLVTVHTTGDPIVPYWHAVRYRDKTITADNIALHEHIGVDRYGHCNFTPAAVIEAFNRLIDMVNDPPAYRPVNRLFLPLVTTAP